MRAIVIDRPGEPAAMRIADLPPPEMRAHDVMIRVAACGVCMHDIVTRNGTFRYQVVMPLIPGHEVAGIVERVGPEVRDFAVGDRVAMTQGRHACGRCANCRSGGETTCPEREFLGDAGLNGGYAEFVCVGEDNVARIPDGVPLDAAAIAACAIGTELHAIREVARLRPGEVVLVSGAGGGLGIHGVQLARLAGAYVLALTTSEGKAEAIRAAGAHIVFVTDKGEDFSVKVRKATAGAGVDVVIDNVGSAVFHPTRRSLAPRGRWILVGQLTGDFVQFNPAQLFIHEISMLSAKGTSRQELRDVLRLIELGQVTPMISHRLGLEQAAKAHEIVEQGLSTGRVVLLPQ